MPNYSEDYQNRLITEAGNLFKTALWDEFVKKLAEKRRYLADTLETTNLKDNEKVFELIKIQGKLSGIDTSLRILQEIIGLGPLPLVKKEDFPRMT